MYAMQASQINLSVLWRIWVNFSLEEAKLSLALPHCLKCQRDLHWVWSHPAFLLPTSGISFLCCMNCSSLLFTSITATLGLLSCAFKGRFKIKPLGTEKPACGIWCEVCKFERACSSAAQPGKQPGVACHGAGAFAGQVLVPVKTRFEICYWHASAFCCACHPTCNYSDYATMLSLKHMGRKPNSALSKHFK